MWAAGWIESFVRRQERRGFSGQSPYPFPRFGRWCASTTVAWVVAIPQTPPWAIERWGRKQWLRDDVELAILAEVHQEKSIHCMVREEADDENILAQHSSVHTTIARAKDRIALAERDQIAMEHDVRGMAGSRAFGGIETTSLERRQGRRIIEPSPSQSADRGKLAEKILASFANELVQLRIVVREVQKGCRRAELLPLEEHWRLRRKEKDRGERAIASGARELVEASSIARVRYLVMVLEIDNATM
jgi:hypothetical protein